MPTADGKHQYSVYGRDDGVPALRGKRAQATVAAGGDRADQRIVHFQSRSHESISG